MAIVDKTIDSVQEHYPKIACITYSNTVSESLRLHA